MANLYYIKKEMGECMWEHRLANAAPRLSPAQYQRIKLTATFENMHAHIPT